MIADIVNTTRVIDCDQCKSSVGKGFIVWQEMVSVYNLKTLNYTPKRITFARCIDCGKLHVKQEKFIENVQKSVE